MTWWFRLFLLLWTPWAAACVVKAANRLRRGVDYTFAGWDGGLVLRGKTLSPLGLRVQLVTTLVSAAAAPYVALGLQPHRVAEVVLFSAVGLGVIGHFTLQASDGG